MLRNGSWSGYADFFDPTLNENRHVMDIADTQAILMGLRRRPTRRYWKYLTHDRRQPHQQSVWWRTATAGVLQSYPFLGTKLFWFWTSKLMIWRYISKCAEDYPEWFAGCVLIVSMIAISWIKLLPIFLLRASNKLIRDFPGSYSHLWLRKEFEEQTTRSILLIHKEKEGRLRRYERSKKKISHKKSNWPWQQQLRRINLKPNKLPIEKNCPGTVGRHRTATEVNESSAIIEEMDLIVLWQLELEDSITS